MACRHFQTQIGMYTEMVRTLQTTAVTAAAAAMDEVGIITLLAQLMACSGLQRRRATTPIMVSTATFQVDGCNLPPA
jgi:hypothetical protein